MLKPWLVLFIAFTLIETSNAEIRAQETKHDHSSQLLSLEQAEKEVVKLTDQGFEPQTITLKKLDGSVFFVNVTKDSLITLSVDYGKHRAHCASSNMKIDAHGVMQSKKPIAPQDFALMCFPEQGSYKITAQGIGGNSQKLIAQVIVK